MFHISALKGYFSSLNKTNKCTYVKCVHHILFITYCSSHTVHHILFIPFCSSHSVHHILFITYCSSHSVHHILFITYCSSYTVHHILFITYCSSHSVHHQHVSVAIATIIMVNDKNVRNPKSLSKCISEQFSVTNNTSNFLYRH